MRKRAKFILLFLLVLILVLIRFYEDVLFYDPYLTFFKNDYLYIDSPRRELTKLVGFTTLRYIINSVVSLSILWVFFRDESIIKFAFLIYAMAFVILISLYLYFVINPKQEDYYLFFNIRRFLIQPVMLIILFSSFYYYKLRAAC